MSKVPYNDEQLPDYMRPHEGGSSLDLPDYKKADQEMKEDLKKRMEVRKQEVINSPYQRRLIMSNFIKPVGYGIALILAGLVTFIFGGAGWIPVVLQVLGSIFGFLGLSDWRAQYDNFVGWFSSKTIWGALLVVVPVLVVVIAGVLSFILPAWALTVLETLITAGGGGIILGIFDAVRKAKLIK